MTRNMGLAPTLGMTNASTEATGLMESSMEKEFTENLTGRLDAVAGKTGNVFLGSTHRITKTLNCDCLSY